MEVICWHRQVPTEGAAVSVLLINREKESSFERHQIRKNHNLNDMKLIIFLLRERLVCLNIFKPAHGYSLSHQLCHKIWNDVGPTNETYWYVNKEDEG